MDELDLDWDNFINDNDEIIITEDNTNNRDDIIPESTNIYISTKTKITYLNQYIDLISTFWKIPLLLYNENSEGVIKKQNKFNSLTKEEVSNINKELENYNNYLIDNYEINHIDKIINDKITYKDVRKISIGICNKDITSYRSKKKSAFYNCFVLIIRIKDEKECFKEIHVKIFNTGKIEIPGIQNNYLFYKTLDIIKNILSSIGITNIDYKKNDDNSIIDDTILINSNFHCGFLINRDKLYNILKFKYNINASFDPCSYPGIQCKYTYEENDNKTTISFMIFRTGSVLIVGKCKEDILNIIYNNIKIILKNEYKSVYQVGQIVNDKKKNTKKIKKKTIYLNS